MLVAALPAAQVQGAREDADLGPAQPGVEGGQRGAAAGGEQQLLEAEQAGVRELFAEALGKVGLEPRMEDVYAAELPTLAPEPS